MNCFLTDSPGLCDKNIPLNYWLDIYNKCYQSKIEKIDMVLVIIEKKERVSAGDSEVFSVLSSILDKICAENIAVIMNKCDEDDEPEDIIDFYSMAKSQANANNLPVLKNMD